MAHLQIISLFKNKPAQELTSAEVNFINDYLQQHPEVFIPENQEPWFFARMDIPENFQREIISNEREYLKLFNNGKNSIAIGESSPVYLACPHAPPDRGYFCLLF